MQRKMYGFSFFAALLLGLTSANGFAQSESETGDVIRLHESLHKHNRAIAFGSVIVAGATGGVEEWKAIDAYDYCDDVIFPQPDPETNPEPIPDPNPACGWDVMITTSYTFTECPDGSYVVSRSGDGVYLTAPTVGEVYGFVEIPWCDEDPLKSKALRPLEPSRIRKTPR